MQECRLDRAARLRHQAPLVELWPLGRHGGHANMVETAGNDQRKGVGIEVHVEGEAVKGHPATHTDPDRGNLPRRPGGVWAREHTGESFAPIPLYLEFGESIDQDRFEAAKECHHVRLPARFEIDDRVPHELTRRVVRHVSAPGDTVHLDPSGTQFRFGDQEVGLIAATSQSDGRRVLEKEQDIPDAVFTSRRYQRVLAGKRVGVGDAAEPLYLDAQSS